jgi:hypothetical protein
MAIGNDIVNGLLGYSLKREYFGESFNYRNVETFTYEIYITDLANINVDPATDRNYLSTYIKNQIATKLAVDKNDINVKSIDIPHSIESKEDLIRIGKYNVTIEVRRNIEDDVMWQGYLENGVWYDPQHAELNPNLINKYKQLVTVFQNFGIYIDSLSEDLTFEQADDHSKTMSHNVNVEMRDGDPNDSNLAGIADISAKGLSQQIAKTLFETLNFAGTFGINVFSNASADLKDPLTAGTNSRFTESYDLKSNKFTFKRKEKVLPDESDSEYTIGSKYSMQLGQDGIVTVTEDLNILSKTNHIASILTDLPIIKGNSKTSCEDVVANAPWDSELTLPSVGTLLQGPKSTKTTYDVQGHSVTLSTVFSSEVTHGGFSSIDESISLERDTKGVGVMDYSVNFRAWRPKELNMDEKPINNAGDTMLDVIHTYDTNYFSVFKSAFESDFTHHHASLFIRHAEGPFFVYHPTPVTVSQAGISSWQTYNQKYWAELNKTITMQNMGKDFSLKKKFTDDPAYVRSLPGCINCFKKIESKITDAWPKNSFSEHVIVNRGIGPDGNAPNSSVLSYGYNSQPGKRTVNLSAMIPRRKWNILHYRPGAVDDDYGPYVPINELKALATEAKRQLFTVFQHPRISRGFCYMGFLSNLSYVFDSSSNVTLTADMTYGYKQIPPGVAGHQPMHSNW